MLPKLEHCRSCVFWGTGRGFSAIEGSGPLLVVAEALGAKEERAGLPLRPDAPAGGVFQKALDTSGLSRESCTLTNIIRCRPPGNELREAPYERSAIDHCKIYLDQIIEEREPSLILALGDVPLRELSMLRGSISELRGFVLQSRYGIPMIASYHPSHLARGAFGTLFVVFMHDLRRAHSYATHGIPEPLETHYDLNPTPDDVRAFLADVVRNPETPVAYDVETASILGEVESENWRDKRIIQIQFSTAAGHAIVLPWTGEYIDLAAAILGTTNLKWDWNGRLSDRLCLRANGIQINGELHDLMNAWAHLQPGFMSGKDETHGDKGVPAKLMSLQSCVSFYFPNEGPWKHWMKNAHENVRDVVPSEYAADYLMDEVRRYGARDADMTFRVGERLFRDLKRGGLW